MIEFIQKYPDCSTILPLVKEYYGVWNEYLNKPKPAPRINQQWWLEFVKTLPEKRLASQHAKWIKNGFELGISHHHGKLLRSPTNFVNSLRECIELLQRLISDIKNRNKQPTLNKPLYISCVWMRDEGKKFRLITHASKALWGKKSLNESINDEYKGLYLYNLNTLCKWLYFYGGKKGLYLITFDLKDYFHHFHLNKRDQQYCGYSFLGKYLYSLFSPYGIASVPKIATKHSDLLPIAFDRYHPLNSDEIY